ncbi:MAG: hypothetical protein IKZ21_03815 [Clostridia bacterium]|nr:hypothetical protein [Clostridia bacterium]
MQPYILFVCDRNTCRSAMAEAFFNHYATQNGLSLRAKSCGIQAIEGEEADWGAVEAMEAYGISLEEHRTTEVSYDLLKYALMIITMTKYQAQLLTELLDKSPELKKRISALEPEIPDPYGGDDSDYRRVAGMLDDILVRLAEAKE